MSLPRINTKEWDAEVKFYETSTRKQRDKRAKELHYNKRHSYQTAMSGRGVHVKQEVNEDAVINLPPVVLKQYKPINAERTGDPETAFLHLTDHHYGEITESYNTDVYQGRLEHLFQSTMRVINLHRNMYPINDLVVPITGDMVHGENPHQGAKVGSISAGARDQVSGALHRLSEFILSLKQEFTSIELHCVRGNHGRHTREAPATSNWDLMLYDQLKIKLEPYGIKVNVSDRFYKIVDIQGLRFFLVHLDQCKGSQGIPWFALKRAIQSWYVTHGGFDYVVGGHFHEDDFLRINSKCKLIMGASLATDDEFTQEIVKTSSIPAQWIWGVHKNKGITWAYSLVADNKYYPTENVNANSKASIC